MTVAVCLSCGQMKAGAWGPCPACAFQPRGAEELAKALILSDNVVARETLAEFSVRRQQGEPFNFSPALVEKFKTQLEALVPLTPEGLPAPAEGQLPGG